MAGLKAVVHVTDERGESHVFGPGDSVPAWAKKKITNSKAWDGDAPADEPTAEEVAAQAAAEAATEAKKKAEAAAKAAKSESSTPTEIVAPPLEGTGSGVKAWREYAVAIELGTAADASKDDILAAIDAKAASTAGNE